MFDTTQCTAHGFTVWHVEAPAGQRYPGGQNPDLNDVVLFIRHERLSGLKWGIMIPEAFVGTGREPHNGFRPAVGMRWQASDDRLSFEGLAYRENIDLDVGAEIAIENDTCIRYRVTVTNPTDRPIENVTWNACLNHRHTDTFGREAHVLGPDGWTRTTDLDFPGDPPIPYFVVEGHQADWQAAGQEQDHYPPHPTFHPTDPLTITRGTCEGRPFTLAHGCPQAALLWHNIKNPCTDLWPWYGTVEPGEQKQTEGRLYFLEGQPEFDEVLRRYRTDPWD